MTETGTDTYAPNPPAPLMARRIRIRGAVQGVGFRPFVYRIAREMGLNGWVFNDSKGVLVHLDHHDTEDFIDRLKRDRPALARIDEVTVDAVHHEDLDRFDIRESETTDRALTRIAADAATCDACLEDICDPDNRRAGYAFTNCTHCGPRFTITRQVPYDRQNTSMEAFPLCPDCAAEYEDPLDRRFHAQPNACPTCGPQLSHPVAEVVSVLKAGGCVALKGLGGYHLMADARQESAVKRLREIKHRDAKPFALMVAGIASAEQLVFIEPEERKLLLHHQRPVVVCRSKPDAGLAPSVSLGLETTGVMLPYTPLHYLLFHEACGKPAGTDWREETTDLVLVATSANIAGNPLIIEDAEALSQFEGKVDLVVTHNRDIVTRVDDSVARVIDGAPALLRRARGFAPDPVSLNISGPPVLALGAALKNAICVTRGNEAFVSQHVGSQDTPDSQLFQLETIAHMMKVHDVRPEAIVTDLHPDMNAQALACFERQRVIRVQHHHAHIASVMAEHQIDHPCFGIALDGYGMGEDGHSSWGGELLLVDGTRMIRLGSFHPLAAPGGDAASREPWRMGLSLLHEIGYSGDHPLLDTTGAEFIQAMLKRGVNAPPTSSAGRLFDGVAALFTNHHVNTFEGQAAMHFEDLVTGPLCLKNSWTIDENGRLSLLPLIKAMVEEQVDARTAANLFHGSLAVALVSWISERTQALSLGLSSGMPIALSGGCFQNRWLAEGVCEGLRRRGLRPLFNRAVPANDGGLALGQAWIAAHTIMKEGV